jgi:hypothetical protein
MSLYYIVTAIFQSTSIFNFILRGSTSLIVGLSFIRENWWRVEDEELDDSMLGGYEIILPRLLEMAIDLGLDVPCDESALQDVYAKRDLKLARCARIYTIDY